MNEKLEKLDRQKAAAEKKLIAAQHEYAAPGRTP